jgi:hypothetical protein
LELDFIYKTSSGQLVVDEFSLNALLHNKRLLAMAMPLITASEVGF